MTSTHEDPVFRDLSADNEPEVTEIESLCLRCQKNGITKLLLTKIPFYKEVVIMSFCCDNCHWENNELQPASKIQEKGIMYKLEVENPRDLTRVVVKTEWASISIPELEFEIPSQSQEGSVTNIEGIIERSVSGLCSGLEYVKAEDPDAAKKLEEFLEKMSKLKSGDSPFTFVLRDCSGNSFVENLKAPLPDPQLEVSHFERSREEALMLGLYIPDDAENPSCEQAEEKSDLKDEVLELPTNCYSCNAPCITNMKDVVIMSTLCETCGHKTNEVKSGSGIEPYGYRATLKIEEHKDLTRDLLKSDTCKISIKEIELEVGSAAFGGRYSTVEGILSTIKEQLVESNPFITGDSADLIRREKMEQFLNKIDEIIDGKRKVTFIMDDPCGNSYLQNIDHPDENLTVEKYERSMEQDDELGLLDMKVENYEES
ncbi:zinc finger protein ZPR1 [Trichonephila clavipes]|nr:zinc finger protein ZPR1 [Trichonephila clavipes]